jgi:L-lactate dehydrogenase complex protein LldE
MSALTDRPSPKGKPVSLFITCIMDMIYPHTGMSVVDLLTHVGVTVDFPESQTCCGQPAFNSGFRDDAKTVAQQFFRAFEHAEVIVTASGSCAAMVRHEYPALFADDPLWRPHAERAAAITWELTEFLVDGLGLTDLGLKLPAPTRVAFHDACHGLRLLGLGEAGRTLMRSVENAQVENLRECEVCCGFGGLFSVKMPEISNAMLQRKLGNINTSDADVIVTGDASCMTHINGGLAKQQSPRRVQHIADILAAGLPAQQDKP